MRHEYMVYDRGGTIFEAGVGSRPPLLSLAPPPSSLSLPPLLDRFLTVSIISQVFFFFFFFFFFVFPFVLTINIIKRTSAVCVGGVGGGRGLTRGHSWRWCVGS